MNKFIFLTLAVFTLIFINSTSISAQACPPENACLCNPNTSYPACCAIEGPGGYNCGGGGSTPPPGGGGGGYSCPSSPTDCPNGIDPNGYSSITYGAAAPPRCPIGTAQSFTCSLGDSCNVDGVCGCAGGYVTTYSCCPNGTSRQQTGVNYTDNWINELPDYPNICYLTSGVSGETYIPPGYVTPPISRRTVLDCVCRKFNVEDNVCYPGRLECQNINQILCRYATPVYACVATCTASSPSTPTLISPTNGATLSSTTVSLSWNNISSWGTACSGQNNQYRVYIGSDPSSLALLGTVGNGTTNINFTGTSGQTYYWRVTASNGQSTTNSNTWSFTINYGPWWQTKDGSATTNGSISSTVLTGSYFSTTGLGGFPGNPVYGNTFNLSSTSTLISDRRWSTNTSTIQPRLFNYGYFKNLVPDDVNTNFTQATDASLRLNGYSFDGYEWYKSNGDLSINSDIDFGNRKVIIFVENGNLNVNGKINLNDGVGFAGFFIEGNMNVNPSVTGTPSIEGIIEVDGNFENGSGNTRFHARGSITVFGGISLSRNLANNATSAELFEFAPDLMFNYPKSLSFRRSKWQEIAP